MTLATPRTDATTTTPQPQPQANRGELNGRSFTLRDACDFTVIGAQALLTMGAGHFLYNAAFDHFYLKPNNLTYLEGRSPTHMALLMNSGIMFSMGLGCLYALATRRPFAIGTAAFLAVPGIIVSPLLAMMAETVYLRGSSDN